MRSRSSGQVLASFFVAVLPVAAPAFACSSETGQDTPRVAGSAGSMSLAAGAASATASPQSAGTSAATSGGAGSQVGGTSAAGDGGAAVAGGNAGTNGVVAGGAQTGGASNGGHSGSSGSAGAVGHGGSNNNEATCQMVKMDYAAELEKQLACNPGAASQCTNRAAAAPGCECRVFIQPSDPFAIEHLSNVGNGWYDADCSMPTCPAKCTSAASGTCQADPNSALGGRCMTP